MLSFQTSSDVSSKVLDDYCWIHSTFHIRTEYQGSVGCLVDPELMSDKSLYTGGSSYYESSHPASPFSLSLPAQGSNTSTPDTSFYQWVPFCLVLQVLVRILATHFKNPFQGSTFLLTKEDLEDL